MIELMPLRIPNHWAVTHNQFYDVDPIVDENSDSEFLKNTDYFTQDLLQIVKTDIHNGHSVINKGHILIDLGYYPDGYINGEYKLELVKPKGDELDWENTEVFRSKDRFEIVAKLELWLEQHMGL